MTFGIVDQPSALAGEITVDLAQRRPQPVPRRIPLSAALFALEDRHGGADALEGDLGILGLAVPNPPVQALDSAISPGSLRLTISCTSTLRLEPSTPVATRRKTNFILIPQPLKRTAGHSLPSATPPFP
jgi:hypothetical protein